MPVKAASFQEHKIISKIAKKSKYTSGFTNIMFSGEDNYNKGWIGVFVERGTIKGFICLRHAVTKKTTVVYDLGVDPIHYGKGIGSELIAWAMKTSPYNSIQLNVDNTNKNAMKFYRHIGFRKIGEGAWGKKIPVPYTTLKVIGEKLKC